MECRDCELWKRHKDKKKQPLTKGTCTNLQFKNQRGGPLITSEHVRCSSGEKKIR